MKRTAIIIVVVLALGAGVALAADGSLHWQTIGIGRVVELIPLEDGSAALITANANSHAYNLYYVDRGMQRHQYDVPWSGDEPALVVRACGQTVHLTLTSSDGLTQYVAWDLPVEVERVYLPIVCRS